MCCCVRVCVCRFPPMKNDEESLVKSVPLSAKKEALAGLHTAGLHTVQLLPIVTTGQYLSVHFKLWSNSTHS